MFSNKELIQISETKNSDFSFFGEGERSLCIFFREENQLESSISFLTKILSALKINLEKDTFYHNLIKKESLSIFQLEGKPKHLFLFGITPQEVGLNIEQNDYKSIQINGINVLSADSLETIKNSENLKRTLWGCLKEMTF